jgi:hypothetical protein
MYRPLLRFSTLAMSSFALSTVTFASTEANPYTLGSAYTGGPPTMGLELRSIAFTQSEEGADEEEAAESEADESDLLKLTPERVEGAAASEEEDAAGSEDESAAAPEEEPLEAKQAAADTDVERRALEADAMYQLGLGLMGKQSWGEACAVFGRVQDVYGDLEAATRAGEQMAMIQQMGEPACGAAPGAVTAAAQQGSSTPAGKQPGTVNGDIELAVSQALMGTAFGVYAPFAIGVPDSALVISATTLAGLATGLGVSLTVANRHGVTQGQAMAVYTGEAVGITHGLLLGPELGIWNVAQPMTAGFVLGGAAGIAAAVYGKPTAGQMSMVRSGVSWGAATGALTILMFEIPSALVVLGGMDLGLVAGAMLSQRLDISRRRMNFINLSGYTGAAGVAILLIGVGGGSPQLMAGVLFVGAGGGLAVGAHLTRDMDGDGAASGSALELRDGKWYLGMPMPEPAPVRVGEDVAMGVRLPIMKGRW